MAYPDLTDHEQAAAWVRAYITLHPIPDFHLGPRDDHQLQRWYLSPRSAVSNAYLHRFLRSDDDRALHDHPWDNTSWILDGEYLEHLPGGETVTRHQGDVVRRAATDPHRVEIVSGPVLTLFFTGPVVRDWGFHCPQGWRYWRDFVAIDNSQGGTGNTIGRGCE